MFIHETTPEIMKICESIRKRGGDREMILVEEENQIKKPKENQEFQKVEGNGKFWVLLS